MTVQSAVRGRGLAASLPLLLVLSCDVPTGLPRVQTRFLLPIDDVVVPVTGAASTISVRTALRSLELNNDVKSATLRVTPLNPMGATGEVEFIIAGGGQRASGRVVVDGPPNQVIAVTGAQVETFLATPVTLSASGTLCTTTSCKIAPPYPIVTLQAELELEVEYGGKGASR